MPKKISEAIKNKNKKDIEVKPEVSAPPHVAPAVARRLVGKAEQMKAHLESLPKVSILIPLEKGERKGAVQPFCLNGYRFTVPKGVMTMVPDQVAEMIAERFNIELDVRSRSLGQQSEKTREALE